MNKKPITKNIFLDTETFLSANFDYQSTAFAALTQLVKEDRVAVYMTTVTVHEIRKNIQDELSKAISAAKRFRSDARVLQQLDEPPFRDILRRFDQSKALASLLQQFKHFCEECDVTVLDLTSTVPDHVFDKYFSGQAPFMGGDKKHEFPDAFAISALNDWCGSEEQEIYVITNDLDWHAACGDSGPLHPLNTLEDFLNLKADEHGALATMAHALLNQHQEEAEQAVREKFAESGFWLDDEDGDVEDVTVKTVEFDQELLLDISDEDALFKVQAKISFEAELIYDDPDFTFYDQEEGKAICFEQKEETVERTVTCPAELLVEFDSHTDSLLSVSCEELNNGEDFPVSPYESNSSLK